MPALMWMDSLTQQHEAAPTAPDCPAKEGVLYLLSMMVAAGHFGAFDASDPAAIEAHVRRVFEEQQQHCACGAEGRPLFPAQAWGQAGL